MLVNKIQFTIKFVHSVSTSYLLLIYDDNVDDKYVLLDDINFQVFCLKDLQNLVVYLGHIIEYSQ